MSRSHSSHIHFKSVGNFSLKKKILKPPVNDVEAYYDGFDEYEKRNMKNKNAFGVYVSQYNILKKLIVILM